MSLMRDRAGRAPVAARQGQAVGRHERRPRLVEAGEPRATRAARTRRHAGPAGWAGWARRLAGQARAWWTEGAERVAALAHERWADRDSGATRTPTGGRLSGGPGWGRVQGTQPAGRSRGEDLVTGWCSLLLVLGLYLDGWNHYGLQGDASRPFPTPWHALLYASLAGTAAWILAQGQRRGAWSLQAVPAGYRPALTGIGLAVVAVATDAVWHLRYAEAQGPARLVAPFHLVLFAGACLLVTVVLRVAWSGPSSARVPGLRAFWPVLWSTTLVVATTAFFFQQVSPLVTWRQPALAGPASAGTMQVYGLLGLLGLAGAAVVGGAAADVAVSLLGPSPQRRWAARAVAVIAPAVYWTAHFALLRAGYGLGLDVPVLLGSVVWASLSGLALALLMWPPAVPLTAWNRGRSAAARSTARSAATPTPMPARMVGR
jgi:hypothetical protein